MPHFSPILGEVGTTVLAAAKIKSPASQAGLGKLPDGTLPLQAESFANAFFGRASAVHQVGALSNLDNISVRIADVAARLAVLRDWLGDELRSSTFP